MVTIRLLGEAGRRFGRRFQLAVRTPAEALRALCVQIPGLRHYLIESGDKGVAWRVVTEHPDGLDEDQLFWPMSKRLVLAPLPAGRGATGKIIAGVALIAASFFLPGAQLGLFGLGQIGLTAFAAPVGALGGALLFGGIADLLTPTPKMPTVKGGVGRSSATTGTSK